MLHRGLLAALVITAATALPSACGPRMPPTDVAPPVTPELQGFTRAVQTYVDKTQPFRKQAAARAENLPEPQKTGPQAEASVRTRQNTLADALKTTIRPSATRGELFTPDASAAIRRMVRDAFSSPKHALLIDELAEQNEERRDPPSALKVNQPIMAPRVPPLLLSVLPALPPQLEYHFLGTALVLVDTDAGLVADFLPDALPASPPAAAPPPASAPGPSDASFFAVPDVRGGTVFVLIGDSGSGDDAQRAVAAAMLRFFTTARHFRYVLMLGDNLYDDDYTGEFLEPYKPLLDRGVTFYATLGNHDRDLEQHFKPFHMQDREYYTFDQGNARFAVLNSNHPADPKQLEWFDSVFDGAGSKWRIAFFHHPLYSSGAHAEQSRDVIRPALEPALQRNHVNVVFSGHEHLYERVAPQHGVRYFVSGGGGRNLYDVDRSPFDEVAVSDHHFMAIDIAGDTMYYEALRPDGRLIDCGIDFRTPEARAKGVDGEGEQWLAACDAARHVRTTQ